MVLVVSVLFACLCVFFVRLGDVEVLVAGPLWRTCSRKAQGCFFWCGAVCDFVKTGGSQRCVLLMCYQLSQ